MSIEEIEKMAELDRWFKEKWVDISKKDKSGEYAPCGRGDSDKGSYPKCRPSKRISKKTPVTTRELTDKEEKTAIRKKRKAERERPTESSGGSARKPKRAPTIKNSDRLIMFSNLLKLATGMVTSFDFDQTIRRMDGSLNQSIVSKIQEAKSVGKVFLITSRSDSKDNVDFVIQYLKDQKNGGESLFSHFDGFYFVGDLKINKLKELGVSKHYDDNDLELSLADKAGILGIKV